MLWTAAEAANIPLAHGMSGQLTRRTDEEPRASVGSDPGAEARALHISWRNLPAGIALPLGISASAELSAAALRSVLGRAGYIPMDFIRMEAFHVFVVIWLVYIFCQSDRLDSGAGLRRSDLELWDQEVQRMAERR
jgi:hypothetical protein